MENKYDTPLFLEILYTTSILNQSLYSDPSIDNTQIIDSNIGLFFSQLNHTTSLNYYLRQSKHHNLYPDDIDDTFSAFYIITSYNRDLVTPQLLAQIITSLDKIRSPNDSILFNTWYSKSNSFASIDTVALSSIVAFFDQTHFPALELKKYIFNTFSCGIKHQISTGNRFSEFYHTPYLPLYLAARIKWANSESLELLEITQSIFQTYTFQTSTTPTDRYLVVGAVCKLIKSYLENIENNYVLDSKKIQIIFSQTIVIYNETKIEDINSDALYIESVLGDKIHYAHSDKFSDALALEAQIAIKYIGNLLKSMHPLSQAQIIKTPHTSDSLTEHICTKTLEQITSHLTISKNKYITDTLHGLLISTDFKIVRDLLSRRLEIYLQNKYEIGPLETNDFIDLLTTHLIGLLGYYLYDKIIDCDIDTTFASVSTYAIYLYRKGVGRALPYSSFELSQEIDEILSNTDIQLLREASKIQYPLHDTANKSLGTAIVAITLFPEDRHIILGFFRSFQMIRQICDDFKDQQDDSAKNKLTTLQYFKTKTNQLDTQKIENTIDKEFDKINLMINNPSISDSGIQSILKNYSTKLKQKIDKMFFEIKTLEHIAHIAGTK